MDELVLAAQLGFVAGFLRSWSSSQAPLLSPCSHSSRQGWHRDHLSDGLACSVLVPVLPEPLPLGSSGPGRRKERLLRGALS